MENKIKLPVYATLGLIMANHTIKSKENSNIVFNEDLVYFQCLLNKNLMLKFGSKMQNKTFLAESTFKAGEKEKTKNKNEYAFSKFIKSAYLLQNASNGLPPIDYVRKCYEYNARKKLSRVKNGELTEEILGQVDSRIALYQYSSPEDYQKARYMYWCGDAILDEQYYKTTGHRRYLDTFENHAKDAYQDGANAVCRVIAQVLGEDINSVYLNALVPTLKEFESYKFFSANTEIIKWMMQCEKLRQKSTDVNLPDDKRQQYLEVFNSNMNKIEEYLENFNKIK